MIKIVDNFYPDGEEQYKKAQEAYYVDQKYDVATFPGIAPQLPSDQELALVEAQVGYKVEYAMPPSFRLYKVTDAQPTFIHNDTSEGDLTVVTFFNKEYGSNNGTAFWTPHMVSDGESAEKLLFVLDTVAQGQFNRAVIFDSHHWHSRYPKDNWVNDGDGRLVKVLFLRRVK